MPNYRHIALVIREIVKVLKKYSGFFMLIGILLSTFLVQFVYEHWGFVEYRYTIFTSKKYTAYQDELLNLVKEDPNMAFRRYREILSLDPFSYNTCHGIAHKMGYVAFTTYGFDTAMHYQDALCGAGYIHGVIEAKFGLVSSAQVSQELRTTCVIGDGPCYHGLGHGLMVVTKLDVEKSLEYCDQLPKLGRRNCYDGVWMHVFDLEDTGVFKSKKAMLSNSRTDTDLTALCNSAKEQYKTSCYFYLPRLLAHSTQIDFNSYMSMCASVPNVYQSLCASGVGHSIMKYHIATPNTSLALCANFGVDTLVIACKEGGALYYLFSNGIDLSGHTMTESLCHAIADDQDRLLCSRVAQYRNTL